MKKIAHSVLVAVLGFVFATHSLEGMASHSKVYCHHGVCHHYKSKHHKKHHHHHHKHYPKYHKKHHS